MQDSGVKLYTGTIEQFNQDVLRNEMPNKLQKAYEAYYYRMANPREVQSWTNSLQFMKNAVEYASLKEDMIVVEYELPYSNQRIDCMLFGRGPAGGENVVLMELKQWSKAEECDVENNVVTFVGGANRMEAHPSYQVGGYHMYLRDFVEAFEKAPTLSLSSACYCHNYPRSDAVLFDDRFAKILLEFPLFAREDLGSLADYLRARLAGGGGQPILERFTSSRVAPSKKLLVHARDMIEGQHVFNLLEEQIAAYNTIVDRAKKSAKLGKKSVIIVRGGPGTGKSAIALNVIAELLSKRIAVYHATGSASFTTTLRRVVGQRASPLFKYFNSFSTYEENQIDVLVCDEAHRIRKTSNSRYTRKEARSDVPQVEELLRAAKVTIFFIDDHQVVRPEEIGSAELIREAARRVHRRGVRVRAQGAVQVRRLRRLPQLGRRRAGDTGDRQPPAHEGREDGVQDIRQPAGAPQGDRKEELREPELREDGGGVLLAVVRPERRRHSGGRRGNRGVQAAVERQGRLGEARAGDTQEQPVGLRPEGGRADRLHLHDTGVRVRLRRGDIRERLGVGRPGQGVGG